MDWLEKMNDAMDYIEDNITWKIDYEQIARIAGCPYYHFQRMFAFITEVSLCEYIRRRRLSIAALELQQSNQSVIDIAQKYGYESHSSFTRAFSEFHGIAPSMARKTGTQLKAYPRLSFHISIKGGKEMSYRIETISPFSAVGVRHLVNSDESFTTIPLIWEKMRQNGISNQLLSLLQAEGSSKKPGGVMGILSGGNWGENEQFSYYTAVPCEKAVPDGMEKLDFPKSQWVVFEAPNLADLPKAWKRLYLDWIPGSGYDLAALPAIECYYPPGNNPQNELWIPIVKKSNPANDITKGII